ncbi:M20 family metallopeptidase [Rhizobium pusense]|uniref:M20 aminoacylase family protein n=1 Tax=Agrobacterium pusense TaxID=648995 RepID=UPI0010AEE8C5|nr:M20 aminoacylase family protein [Agrobacterium pusense]MDH0117099.1 M20 family metallopeptidase [Agrobacterium pusense]
MHDEIIAWRRDLHANPELGYELPRTASFVADKLRVFGCDQVTEAIGRSGVVGVIHGRNDVSGKVIGLRADMDALPIQETTGLPYASTIEGRMHACGHDGHTAMLLGAAKALAETRNFDGTAVVIFQPAEEGQGGAKAMCDDGLMTRWGIERVFALHNEPGLDVGRFATRTGPFGAAVASFKITIDGRSAHAASPHAGVDALLPAANILIALQTIIARNVHPLKSGVISFGSFQGGNPGSTFVGSSELRGLARWFEPEVRDIMARRIVDISEGIASSYGATATVTFRNLYPAVVNHPAETALAVEVACRVMGEDAVDPSHSQLMGSEDFAFMLEQRPGNIALLGNGSTAGLHDPNYDFNDAAIPYGMAYWMRLVETALPLQNS